MTTINFTTDRTQNDGILIVNWMNMANGATGEAFMQTDWCGDRTVQVDGTFGSGGNCAIQGSNDGNSWFVLSDNTGNVLNISTLKTRNVFDAPLYFRPLITAGDGTTALNVRLLFRRQLQRAW